MKKALVLSGGGARCIAQLGYISVLEKQGIEFDCFSGSSGGAIAASFLANGFKAKEIFEIIKEINVKKYIKLNLFRSSIFHLKKLEPLLKSYGLINFDSLKYKLFIAITDYEEYKTIYINKGDLAKYIIASSSLIPIFAPYKIENKFYIDGGFSDNLPVTPCKNYDFILAINVNPPIQFKNSFFGNLYRAGYIMLNSNIKYSKKLANKYVELKECGNYSIFDTKNFDEIFKIGEDEAKKELNFWEKFIKLEHNQHNT